MIAWKHSIITVLKGSTRSGPVSYVNTIYWIVVRPGVFGNKAWHSQIWHGQGKQMLWEDGEQSKVGLFICTRNDDTVYMWLVYTVYIVVALKKLDLDCKVITIAVYESLMGSHFTTCSYHCCYCLCYPPFIHSVELQQPWAVLPRTRYNLTVFVYVIYL